MIYHNDPHNRGLGTTRAAADLSTVNTAANTVANTAAPATLDRATLDLMTNNGEYRYNSSPEIQALIWKTYGAPAGESIPAVTPTDFSEFVNRPLSPVVSLDTIAGGSLVTPGLVSHPATPIVTTNSLSPSPQDQQTPTVTTSMFESGSVWSNIKDALQNLNPVNYVDTLASNDPNREWINGLPNWATIGIGLAIIGIWSLKSGEGFGSDLGGGFSMSKPRRRVRNPKASCKHIRRSKR